VENIVQGTYTITALAINSQRGEDLSNAVTVSIGKPPMTRLEAEKAMVTGSGIAVNCKLLEMQVRFDIFFVFFTEYN